MRETEAEVRVLVVEVQGLGEPDLGGLLDRSGLALVRAHSVKEARDLLRSQSFDVVVTEDTQLRGVLDAIFAFVGLFSLEGRVVDVNQAPLAASGFRREQVVGHRFVELPWFAESAEERSRISAAIAAAARGESVRVETRIRSMTGPLKWIDAGFLPLRDGAGNITHVVGSGVDITARHDAEQALAESEARLAEAQRVAHIGSWEWNVPENRVRWSDELYRIYGLAAADFVPTYEGFVSRVYPDDVEHTEAVLRVAVRDVTPFVYDHRIRRPDGSVRMLHTRGEVIGDGKGGAARLVGSSWDITERWLATGALRALAARLESIREEERRVMAREIHDQIGQALTALKLDLEWLMKQLDGDLPEAAARRAAAMDALLDQTMETARRVSANLRPAVLDDLGLGAAIQWQAREFEKRTGVRCGLRLPVEEPPLPPEVAVCLFRIVQEALTNVARHAGAKRVRIDLVVDEAGALLTVTDDGRGVTADEIDRPTSLGVLGMRERALVAGGSFDISSAAAKTPTAPSAPRGTTVTVRVPTEPAPRS